jgi:hypothetical protein
MNVWSTLTERWPELSPLFVLLAALTGWVGRRRGWHPWEAFVGQFNLNKALTACRQDLARSRQSTASCEEAIQSEIRLRQAAHLALEEMVKAGSLSRQVLTAIATTGDGSSGSSGRRSSSRRRSTTSRAKRKPPLGLP